MKKKKENSSGILDYILSIILSTLIGFGLMWVMLLSNNSLFFSVFMGMVLSSAFSIFIYFLIEICNQQIKREKRGKKNA